MKRPQLLLVDDDRLVLDAMANWLRDKGYVVTEASTCRSALAQIEERSFDLVLTDLRLQDGDGFEIVQYCRQHRPATAVILITGYATAETGVQAIRAGAFDLLTKPLIDEDLELALTRVRQQRQIQEETAQFKTQLDLRFGMDNIVGQDPRMLRMFEIIDSIADTRATALITGESGTGKSLVAKALHRRSSRHNKPFVEVACGALSETLLESELFGHVAGAFTGAVGDKLGKFMQADGGTIFLDEIGTASPGMQVKLLRVLQEREFEQVGGMKTFRIDTRVILATNEDLRKGVAQGTFRQDLYYRINVINIELPPLRERIADIPQLAQHFLQEICAATGKHVEGFCDETLAVLQTYPWPGNVRELQNAVERAVLLGKHSHVRPEDLPRDLADRAPASTPVRSNRGPSLKRALEIPERQIILETLREHRGNRNATAAHLGINRTTLYKKMKRLGLEDQFGCLAGVSEDWATAQQ